MIKDDSFKLGLTNVLVRIIGLFLLIPIYRLLDKEGLLLIAITFVPFIFFTDFCSIGIVPGFSYLTSKYTKENNKDKLNYIFNKSKKVMIIVGIVFSILLILLTPLLVNIYDHNISIKIIKYSFIAIIPTILIFPTVSIYKGYLLGKGDINKVSISIIIENTTRFILIFISSFITTKVFDLPYYIIVILFIIASFLGLLVSLIYLRFHVNEPLNTSTKYDYLKEMFVTFIPIGVCTIFITIYLAIDLSVVNQIKDQDMSIFLFTTPRLLIIPILLSQAVAATTMPLITKTKDKDKKSEEINNAIELVICVSIVAIFLFFFFSRALFTLFYDYKKVGIVALKYFSILILFYSLNKVLIGIVQGIKKLKYIFVASLCSYVLKFILNLLFINTLGYYSFLISSILSILVVIVTSLVILIKENLYSLKDMFKCIFVNTLPCLVTLFIVILLNLFINVGDNKVIIATYLILNFVFFIITFKYNKKITILIISSYTKNR